jgi:hypothetical protein
MPSLIAFANELAKYFVSSNDNKKAATHVIYELNTHRDDYFKLLSYEEKKIVVQLMDRFISGDLLFNLRSGEMIIRKQEDHDKFLEVKKYILKSLRDKQFNE